MLKLITAPSWPVNNTEIREHVRDDSLPDYVADRMKMAALFYAQEFTRRAITEQEWDLILDEFPRSVIHVPLPPLQTVDSITYIDPDGNPQTWTEYDVDTAGGRITPAYGKHFPSTRAVNNALTVRFTAGYADAEVPQPILAAMFLLIGDLYANREAQQDAVLSANKTVERLLWPYRWL